MLPNRLVQRLTTASAAAFHGVGRAIRPAALGTFMLLFACGCGTVITRSQGLYGPYTGANHDLEKIASGDEWSDWSVQGGASSVPFFLPRALVWMVDLPLSAVSDTLLLPVDLFRPADPGDESP